jgi:outer membrane receptor protein involved in Fe transport
VWIGLCTLIWGTPGAAASAYTMAIVIGNFLLSAYLLTMAAANLNVPAWADDYGQLDASVQFNVTPNVTIGVQAVNLSDSTYKVLVDNLHDAGLTYHNWVSSDRRYNVFVRASL